MLKGILVGIGTALVFVAIELLINDTKAIVTAALAGMILFAFLEYKKKVNAENLIGFGIFFSVLGIAQHFLIIRAGHYKPVFDELDMVFFSLSLVPLCVGLVRKIARFS